MHSDQYEAGRGRVGLRREWTVVSRERGAIESLINHFYIVIDFLLQSVSQRLNYVFVCTVLTDSTLISCSQFASGVGLVIPRAYTYIFCAAILHNQQKMTVIPLIIDGL